MRIVPTLVWMLEGETTAPLDARLLPLLDAVAANASLAAAVAQRGISYRAAWGLLRDYQRLLGEPLVLLERGRGARLTPTGMRMRAAQAAAGKRLSRILPALAVAIDSSHDAARAPACELRIAASHDLALAALAAGPSNASGLRLELSFMGSLNALREFAEGRVDVAGFHVPVSGHANQDRSPFLRGLKPRRDRLIRFVDREQGLILPRGNPKQVKRFRDIVRQRLCFINRQRGSGTRLLIDQQVVDERLDSGAISGYADEEFTHLAVAATVASGGADVGFGLRAAAAEYQLAFVPLVRERYFLAVHARDLDTAAIARLLGLLRGAALGRIARRLPGYSAAAAGTVASVDAIGDTGA